MNKNIHLRLFFLLVFLGFIMPCAKAQNASAENDVSFIKRENISGVVFSLRPEREVLLTKFSADKEELLTGNAKYRIGTRYWNMLDYKQETVSLMLDAGVVGGTGNWIDSTMIREIRADHNLIGLRANAAANYSSRFYYDIKNYTLVEVNAWGRYDAYQQFSEGEVTDSNGVTTVYDEQSGNDKLRYGFRAKAAWGMGRLNVVNHYMVAGHLLNKNYPRRNFSDDEILKFSQEIARIKHRRDVKLNRLTEKEIEQLKDFLKTAMMLKVPEDLQGWEFGEFFPRYNGNRLEFGPFFNYYNREPDFVYGAFVAFNNAKYIDTKKNRDFGVSLSYNRYKNRDWLQLETDLNWAFYFDLKSRLTIGAKYIPAITVNDFEDFGPLANNFIPYAEYFTQLNDKARLNVSLAWNISDNEQFIQPGPEISVAFYRSWY